MKKVILLLTVCLLNLTQVLNAACENGECYKGKKICAVVKIRIKQKLTLERQAFDAELVVNNDLESIPLKSVKVDIHFKDENGKTVLATSDSKNEKAAFFIKTGFMDNIENVDGSGEIAPKSRAEMHWLIIPSPGAAENKIEGKKFYVGATLSYTENGQAKSMAIGSDIITVKPTPKLALDYFITKDVYADNPFTPQKEAPVPFSLGVLVRNTGIVDANNVKIESQQPEIIENKEELLIDFKIIGSQVNNTPANTGLLANFGQIPAQKASMARWIMETTLAGTFTEISATVSHKESLGGDLTAIIRNDDIKTHLLMGIVRHYGVDRDEYLDFLADDGKKDEPKYRLYETDGQVSDIQDLSSQSKLSFKEMGDKKALFTLSVPKTSAPFFVNLKDPTKHKFPDIAAKRQDGRVLPKENAWLQYVRVDGGTQDARWESFFRLFDINGNGGDYELAFSVDDTVPQPPQINPIPDQKIKVGEKLKFTIEAFDLNGDTVNVELAKDMPKGILLRRVSGKPGYAKYDFVWLPRTSDNRLNDIKLIAFDGAKKSETSFKVTIEGATGSRGIKDFLFYSSFED